MVIKGEDGPRFKPSHMETWSYQDREWQTLDHPSSPRSSIAPSGRIRPRITRTAHNHSQFIHWDQTDPLDPCDDHALYPRDDDAVGGSVHLSFRNHILLGWTWLRFAGLSVGVRYVPLQNAYTVRLHLLFANHLLWVHASENFKTQLLTSSLWEALQNNLCGIAPRKILKHLYMAYARSRVNAQTWLQLNNP